MKYLILFISTFFIADLHAQTKTDSLLTVLESTIKETNKFDADKKKVIEVLNNQLNKTSNSDLIAQFKIYNQ